MFALLIACATGFAAACAASGGIRRNMNTALALTSGFTPATVITDASITEPAAVAIAALHAAETENACAAFRVNTVNKVMNSWSEDMKNRFWNLHNEDQRREFAAEFFLPYFAEDEEKFSGVANYIPFQHTWYNDVKAGVIRRSYRQGKAYGLKYRLSSNRSLVECDQMFVDAVAAEKERLVVEKREQAQERVLSQERIRRAQEEEAARATVQPSRGRNKAEVNSRKIIRDAQESQHRRTRQEIARRAQDERNAADRRRRQAADESNRFSQVASWSSYASSDSSSCTPYSSSDSSSCGE